MSRNDSKGEIVLKTLLKVTTRELGEDVVFSSYKSLLGIAIRGGLQFALGPAGYVLPLADLIGWMTKIGAKTIVELYKSHAFETSYHIRSGKSGILIAENNKPLTLVDFPIQLPEYLEIPRTELFPAKPQNIDLSFFQIAGSGLSSIFCDECKQPLNGHAAWCSQNPNKPISTPPAFLASLTCSECGQYFGHTDNCSLNPNKPISTPPAYLASLTCSECGQYFGHTDNCSLNPNKPISTPPAYLASLTCSECGQYFGHTDNCSQNPNKLTINLLNYQSPWACNECGHFFIHSDSCSRNPSKPTVDPSTNLSTWLCSECGWLLPGHADGCSYNPNKPPINLLGNQIQWACAECGQYFGHSAQCSQKYKK